MSALDKLWIKRVFRDGVELLMRGAFDFVGPGWSLTSNPATNRIEVRKDGGNAAAVQLHTAEADTVGLFQFQGDLLDASPTEADLTNVTGGGVLRFTELLPGIKAVTLFSNTKFIHDVADTPLELRGDMTAEFFVQLRGYGSGAIFSYDQAVETEVGNFLYAAGLTGAPTQLQWASEHGAGVDDAYNVDLLPPIGALVHMGVRRQANKIQWFMFGKPWGAESSALAAPTGGDDARFRIGWEANNTVECELFSLRISNTAHSNAAMLATYNASAGPLFGLRS